MELIKGFAASIECSLLLFFKCTAAVLEKPSSLFQCNYTVITVLSFRLYKIYFQHKLFDIVIYLFFTVTIYYSGTVLWSDADFTGFRLLRARHPFTHGERTNQCKETVLEQLNFIVPMSAVRSIKTVCSIGQQNIAYQSHHIGDHLIAIGRGCSLPPPLPHRDTDVRLDSVPWFP